LFWLLKGGPPRSTPVHKKKKKQAAVVYTWGEEVSKEMGEHVCVKNLDYCCG